MTVRQWISWKLADLALWIAPETTEQIDTLTREAA